ncbi:MAG: hypothetical protein KR126chlam5_01577 [Candidatus Anoxychlamydiales bacterium]|nr:hypothetical protein [Candidatus Anoxychlamydiales bacterium]
MKGGRARWKIENETFNTLKNQGYQFEHNFGHSKKNLCSVMGIIMLLAFLVDQMQLLCCKLFQHARTTTRTFYNLWETMRAMFKFFYLTNWESFIYCLTNMEIPNTS